MAMTMSRRQTSVSSGFVTQTVFWAHLVFAAATFTLVSGYNVSGGYCEGGKWETLRDYLRRWSEKLSEGKLETAITLAIAAGPGATTGNANALQSQASSGPSSSSSSPSSSSSVRELLTGVSPCLPYCPEGIASLLMGAYAAGMQATREAVMDKLANEVSFNWRLPVLAWRLERGGWPDFGLGGGRFVVDQVLKRRFPLVADLMIDTTPFYDPGTPKAPETLGQGWFWNEKETSHQGRMEDLGDEKTSIDLGMYILLRRSPILKHRRGLLLVDVGVFDGESLLFEAVKANMSHKVLGFEPVIDHRFFAMKKFMDEELSRSLLLYSSSEDSCARIDAASRMKGARCHCTAASSCAVLVDAGLAAAEHHLVMAPQGAHTSAILATFGGETYAGEVHYQTAKFITAEPVIKRWAHDILRRDCVDIHLLKVDVEGAEFGALRSFEKLISEHRVRFLFMEVWPAALMSFGTDVVGLLKWLAHYGFHCRVLGTFAGASSFEDFVAPMITEVQMSSFRTEGTKLIDMLCEDLHWRDPCGWDRAGRKDLKEGAR